MAVNFKKLAAIPFVLAIACAEGSVNAPDGGDASLPGSDMGGPTNITPNVMPGPDMATANNIPSTCIVNETTCLDAMTVGRCRPDQMGYDQMPCTSGTNCIGGVCSAEQLCTPGALECLGDDAVLRCRANGEGYIQMTCEPPLKCGEGVCTDKLPSGAGCTMDDECASMNCRCGSGTDDACPPALGSGICANTSCVVDGCGLAGYCLASAQAPTGAADYDHCVRACDTTNTCPSGSKCVGVPVHVGTGVEFRDACYFTGVKGFGDDCTAPAECLTGDCLTGYFSTGFCSRRCDADGACSDGAACVELVVGQFWCTLTCGDGSPVGNTDPCPLDVPNDRFDVTCKNLSVKGGGAKRVCATP